MGVYQAATLLVPFVSSTFGTISKNFSATLNALEIFDIIGFVQVTALFETADGNIILFKLIFEITFTNVHHIQCQRATQFRSILNEVYKQ